MNKRKEEGGREGREASSNPFLGSYCGACSAKGESWDFRRSKPSWDLGGPANGLQEFC